MNNNLVLEVNGLSKKYKKRTVVNNVSFNGFSGEVLGFLGPNGAGKTTTIKMITGLIKKNSGLVNIMGHELDNDFENAIKNVGAIVETPTLYENMSGKDNILYFAKAKRATNEQVDKIFEFINIGEQIKDKVKGYSLGMKQRIGIGIALLSSPKLLILDEPTNGLDPDGIRNLRNFLKNLAHNNGVCVFVSSHILAEMENLCDRVIIISHGMMIGEANIKELTNDNKSLEDFYISLVDKEG